jgi:hypothetical protein
MEVVGCLSLPTEVLGRPGLAEKILATPAAASPPRPLGPSRAELLELVG